MVRGPDASPPTPGGQGREGPGAAPPPPTPPRLPGGLTPRIPCSPPAGAEGDFGAAPPSPWLLDPGERGLGGTGPWGGDAGRRFDAQVKVGSGGTCWGAGATPEGGKDVSFKHLTANGSVDRGQPARAGGGRGRAHLVPADPSEGQGARLPVPPPGRPRGSGAREPGERGLGGQAGWGGRGAPGWGGVRAPPGRPPAGPGTGAEPWRRPAPRGPEGAPLSALCVRVPWRAASPAAALSDLGLFHEGAGPAGVGEARGACARGRGGPAGCCEPGPGAGPGRWPGRASELPGAARPGRPPLPPTAAALPARRGGGGGRRKEFLSQITSAAPSPVTHVGAGGAGR